MKHSFRVKLVAMLLLAILATIGLCLVFNSTLLVKYYQYNKIKALGEVYEEINTVISAKTVNATPTVTKTPVSDGQADGTDGAQQKEAEDGETALPDEEESLPEDEGKTEETELTAEEVLELDILCTRSNVSAVVAENWLVVGWITTKKLAVTKYVFGSARESRDSSQFIQESVRDYLFPGASPNIKNKETVHTEEAYSIYSLYDDRMQSNFLELYGYLDNGDIVLLRSNIESMQESVGIANKFLLYAGMFTACIVAVIMFFVSRRFTGPIQTLSGIAKKMSNLDFDVKYEGKTRDEIGELGESINCLAERLEETISDLKSANNELQSDNERKTQVDEMRKEFLSNVTHELKTPIALIQGYAEGLKDNISDDAESREFYCDVIIDEAVKMNKMVQKLLTLNQLEFGKTQIEMERFDLTELIRSVLNATEILRKQKEVTLHFEEEGPVYVWADESMIEEVLTNYISNAFHHVAGAKIIEVKVIKYEEHVRVAVFNTGEPIPEEDLDKVWIKFYKVDKARTREYGGSGIGLSIVKAIMDSHNQRYGVNNRETGVEFWFELDSCLNTKLVV